MTDPLATIRKLTSEEAGELKRRLRNWSREMQPEAYSPFDRMPKHWIGKRFIWLEDALQIIENRTERNDSERIPKIGEIENGQKEG